MPCRVIECFYSLKPKQTTFKNDSIQPASVFRVLMLFRHCSIWPNISHLLIVHKAAPFRIIIFFKIRTKYQNTWFLDIKTFLDTI
ncbi:hypothetical protein HMPREF1015_02659 [Bacillus smithii 7_3_47FAA]|uniref:Uncharacterized protein n=1 Tax=Bacillus smithii 7_3_47FAA TaxID=665952 RepID=G9QLK4_9BACI|nr:hypothetical protein HMPREF1015_02659 [Bacillus smithii 7_3_47FAA]